VSAGFAGALRRGPSGAAAATMTLALCAFWAGFAFALAAAPRGAPAERAGAGGPSVCAGGHAAAPAAAPLAAPGAAPAARILSLTDRTGAPLAGADVYLVEVVARGHDAPELRVAWLARSGPDGALPLRASAAASDPSTLRMLEVRRGGERVGWVGLPVPPGPVTPE